MLSCGNIGHIKTYCRAKESNMAQKLAKVEEEWEQCLAAEARGIDVMISINLTREWIKDFEYNIFDHLEK